MTSFLQVSGTFKSPVKPHCFVVDEKGGGAAKMARKLQNPPANIAAVITYNVFLFGTGDNENLDKNNVTL